MIFFALADITPTTKKIVSHRCESESGSVPSVYMTEAQGPIDRAC